MEFAIIRCDEFELAKAKMSDLNWCRDYEDWLDFREGSLLGLAMAGERVSVVHVDLGAFLGWCSDHSRRPDQSALDGYAKRVAAHPALLVD